MRTPMPTQIYAKIFIDFDCVLTYIGTKEQKRYLPEHIHSQIENGAYVPFPYEPYIRTKDIGNGNMEFYDRDEDESYPVSVDNYYELPYYMKRIF